MSLGFNTHAIHILEDAYKLIKNKLDWVQGCKFATIAGTPIKIVDKDSIPTIRRYSLDGAIHYCFAQRMRAQKNSPNAIRFTDQMEDYDYENAVAAIALCVKEEPATYNDRATTKHQDVLAVILQAIELLSTEQAKYEKPEVSFKQEIEKFNANGYL